MNVGDASPDIAQNSRGIWSVVDVKAVRLG